MHWLGPGFKICLSENEVSLGKHMKILFFSVKHTYFVTYTHPILAIETLF